MLFDSAIFAFSFEKISGDFVGEFSAGDAENRQTPASAALDIGANWGGGGATGAAGMTGSTVAGAASGAAVFFLKKLNMGMWWRVLALGPAAPDAMDRPILPERARGSMFHCSIGNIARATGQTWFSAPAAVRHDGRGASRRWFARPGASSGYAGNRAVVYTVPGCVRRPTLPPAAP